MQLLAVMPLDAGMSALWVRAALPLVRDVEATLQQQLLDQFYEIFIVRATAMAGCPQNAKVPYLLLFSTASHAMAM